MNVYDFDGTILYGDSERYFIKYIYDNIKEANDKKEIIDNYKKDYQNGIISRERLYELTYSTLLKFIDNLDDFLENFWDAHEKYIKKWYIKAHADDDVIISATPEFILIPIIKRLHINNLIASNYDIKNEKIIGRLCYKDEKVNRYKKIYNDIIPDNFYSDSDTDIYMALISKNAYKVIDDKIIKWEI